MFVLSLSPFSPIFLLCHTSVCFPPSRPVLLQQQNQPASKQCSAGRPSQQRPPACGARARLSGRVSNDDDPGATVALPQLATGTCLLYTWTGRVGWRRLSLFYHHVHRNSGLYHLICFLSTDQQPMWPHPSSTRSKQAPPASTQAPALQNTVLTVRGSVQALHSFTSFTSH